MPHPSALRLAGLADALGAANITWNVLEAMQRSWGEVDDENTTKVTFRFNVQGTEKKDAAFPNLHSLLNSVPVLQGQE